MYFYILIILFSLVSSYFLAQPEFVSYKESPPSVVTSNLANPDTPGEPATVSGVTVLPGDHLTTESVTGKVNLSEPNCLGMNANCPLQK